MVAIMATVVTASSFLPWSFPYPKSEKIQDSQELDAAFRALVAPGTRNPKRQSFAFYALEFPNLANRAGPSRMNVSYLIFRIQCSTS